MAKNFVDIPPGATFGKWTVLASIEKNARGTMIYRCRCECGYEKNIVSHALKGGETKQCLRCYTRERRNLVSNSCS